MRYSLSPLSHLFIALSGLGLVVSAGCVDLPDDAVDLDEADRTSDTGDAVPIARNLPDPGEAIPAPFDAYFDPPADDVYQDDYRVVGQLTPPSWSWGKIELLEGLQAYRTEGYNLRTQKPRWQDTYEDGTYPLQTYFGALNQQLVDGFNLHYKSACAGKVGSKSAPSCPSVGPTRPEARFVLLQHGPKTGKNACDPGKVPVLLVHGALQNGNVWLLPGGRNGSGAAYPGTTQKTGFVQALEATGRCTYAITFGNFHGDNYSQATHVANAIDRIKELTGQPKVDVIAWSKGVLSVDLYAGDVATWDDFGPKHFERLAAEQAKRVPTFRDDVRVYVPLSGPHLGIDLNFRHPYDDLLIYSTLENAPVGQGPVTWGWMSALQCVNWGYGGSPLLPNQFAQSVCDGRGGTWPDFFSRIYSSNITGLDAAGRPVSSSSLEALNAANGASQVSFDKYNLAMWGSVDEHGKHVSAYLGQLQAAYDLRPYYPIPDRQSDGEDWSELDTDETKWRTWMSYKLTYMFGGYLDDDDGHIMCRETAFDPAGSPCQAQHVYYDAENADDYSWGYATYRLMDGIGIQAVMEIGGNFIERLRHHGLSSELDFLYVVHGTTGGAGAPFEIDGMSCPTCEVHGDGVLFDVSVAARDQLTQGWPGADKAARSRQEGVPFGHLEVGVTPAVWKKIISQLDAVK
ncbi:alpha/beta hydrolase [Nannocystis sp. RBIL2]|uniref:esterase/lipase family protein n=1 Tax=Nannocystis sp. RBIL2 TaxID=2996788 RepID=UPI002271B05E|nr:alpha/beta hydrolase [Nannocystis sp. RBIL2]MCY1065702.1 alpha/beta hydrolase [Nannocystis sp. RBIL2]